MSNYNRQLSVTEAEARTLPTLTNDQLQAVRDKVRNGETVHLIAKRSFRAFTAGRAYIVQRIDSDNDIVLREDDRDSYYLNEDSPRRDQFSLVQPETPESAEERALRERLAATVKTMTLDSLVLHHTRLVLETEIVKAEFDRRTAAIRSA